MRLHQHKALCTALPPAVCLPALLTPCSEPRELTHWRQMQGKAGLFSCYGCRTAVPGGSTGFLLWFERWDLHPKQRPSVGRSLQSAGCKQCSSCTQAAPSLGNTYSMGSCLWSNTEELPLPQSGLLPLHAVYWKAPAVLTTGLSQSGLKPLQMPANLPLHFHTNNKPAILPLLVRHFLTLTSAVTNTSKSCMHTFESMLRPTANFIWLHTARLGPARSPVHAPVHRYRPDKEKKRGQKHCLKSSFLASLLPHQDFLCLSASCFLSTVVKFMQGSDWSSFVKQTF